MDNPRQVFPPIEQYRITLDRAQKLTKEAREKIFEKSRGEVYHGIYMASDKGSYSIEYRIPDNCNRDDIVVLEKELVEKGFKAEIEWGRVDILKVSWYPQE
jgi:glutamate mutase epsilon subunit